MNRYRLYLRIGWTTLCGLTAVLLIALWVRSYQPASGPNAAFKRGYYDTHLDSEQRLWSVRLTDGATIISVARRNDPDLRLDGTAKRGGWTISFAQSQLCGFGLLKKDRSLSVRCPVWSALALAITASVVPWVYQPRWQFTLRTMLICVTALAVVLGALAYLARS